MSAESPIIPTRYRSKIAHTLSYPIGAEAISLLLKEAPQFAEFEVTFYGSWGDKYRSADAHKVLTIGYRKSANSISTSSTEYSQRRLNRQWQIIVHPVDRVQKYLIKQKLIAALPQAMPWLQQRSDLDAIGSDQICFVFDRRDESITMQSTSHLSPQTASKR
jgi:hypothetical protein